MVLNRKQLLASALATLALAGAARAQLGTGLLQWQITADEGATWHSELEVPQSQLYVRVRAMASWDADAGYLFSGVRMDMVWHSMGAGGWDDEVFDARYNPQLVGTLRPIAITRFGPTVKIDDAADTLPPGEGPRGVNISQPSDGFGYPVDRSNPIMLFTYQVLLDGTPGDRFMTSYFTAPSPPGNTTDRFMRIYTSREGATNIPLSTLENATLRVIPAPGSLAGVLLYFVLAHRRARPGSSIP